MDRNLSVHDMPMCERPGPATWCMDGSPATPAAQFVWGNVEAFHGGQWQWTYAFDVSGAYSEYALAHHKSIDLVFQALNLRYSYFHILEPGSEYFARRYVVPIQYRDSWFALDIFLKTFLKGRAEFNVDFADVFPAKMSVVYEARNFIHDGNYPSMGDPQEHDRDPDADRFTDPNDAVVSELASVTSAYNAPPHILSEPDTRMEARLDLPASPMKDSSPSAATPQRLKAIPKPERDVTKNADGKFVCTWPNCVEAVKVFSRKCEWNKHMDKHDRPYKCTADGCEKLPGFTYSGGLLRHEREVHGKHGGPKNSFNCPHPNCKRNSGKGFSRMENLNEHLRRVHTQNGIAAGSSPAEDSDVPSETAGAGMKRKRPEQEEQDLREEIKRVRQENDELRRQVQNQNRQTVTMMQQIAQLQESLGSARVVAPNAPML